MSEKLCLQWNDFNANINKAFGNLRKDLDFTDVTLASDDGYQVEAQVLLAASSPFFKDILVKNKHNHPLIYMRGVKAENMTAIVDFLYNGEANVSQELLDSFLALASDLKLKGLMSTDEAEQEKADIASFQPTTNCIETYVQQKKLNDDKDIGSRSIVAKMENHSEDFIAELDVKVKSMMEKGQNMISYGKGKMWTGRVCKVCGKEGQIVSIRDHIEANHLEGIDLPCNFCEKTFRSRSTLRRHMYSHSVKN